MASHSQAGSKTVDAFQWVGPTLASTTFPVWAKRLALHTPGDGSLHVPTPNGTFRMLPGEWAMQMTTGDIRFMTNAEFVAYYS
jgi:hypothetical protein